MAIGQDLPDGNYRLVPKDYTTSSISAEGNNPYSGPAWASPNLKKPIRRLFPSCMSRYGAGTVVYWLEVVDKSPDMCDAQ